MLKHIQPVTTERVIGEITPAIDAASKEIGELINEFALLKVKLERLDSLLDAKKTLFWELIRRENERADSANARGLQIGIRALDGRPVIVEFKEKPTDPMELFKKLFGA